MFHINLFTRILTLACVYYIHKAHACVKELNQLKLLKIQNQQF